MTQQNTSTYFVSVPQIGSDASFLVLEKNINSLNNLQDYDKSIDNYDLSVNQLGVNNVVEVKNGMNDIQLIGQKGRDNYYNFIDYYNNSPTKINALQEGNANSLLIYGTNSLMENVKIIQKSNYKTIIVRNY
ncbi:hypothetical protein CSC81_15650 [Tenacibaculum discolor]|uniref:Uncharacterized protein n=1 Tax=Tenacibaculum discolor TaxID=361581 RepID=A0A2G1BQ49_9FLAO|nr:hypothetical protein [Tenacibaculum discolor]MDP2542921.1 hypothetical protein [Tenacibaculum discolor]PHN96181.1 hypothetical protein CSC81_15650 [Tenacibaculum discolor]